MQSCLAPVRAYDESFPYVPFGSARPPPRSEDWQFTPNLAKLKRGYTRDRIMRDNISFMATQAAAARVARHQASSDNGGLPAGSSALQWRCHYCTGTGSSTRRTSVATGDPVARP